MLHAPGTLTVFLNARILTLDPRRPTAAAMAVQDGLILAVGTQEEMLALAGPEAALVDLQGQVVLPGFHDSHMHLLSWGLTMDGVQLTGVRSMRELIAEGQAYIRDNPGRQWIIGRGFSDEVFTPRRLPTREDLDQISTVHPIIFTRVCGHICSVNSRALELAGINGETADPAGGRIDRDPATGQPTGVLRENAMDLVTRLLPSPTVEDYKRAICRAGTEAAALGLTTVQTNDLHGASGLQDRLQAYLDLDQAGQLPLRIILQASTPTLEDLRAYAEIYRSCQPGAQLKLGPVKLYADGSLGGRTAALSLPYADAPETDGVLIYQQAELDALVCTAAEYDLQVAVHAIGDAALDQVLNSCERARERHPNWSWRPRVIHAQITRYDQLERMARLGVVADIQPIFVPTDLHFVERRVGATLAQYAYAWKTMQRLGIRTAGGSDCPVEPCNPLAGLHAALTRQDGTGYPPGGWQPQERLTIEEALQLFSSGPAYAAHEEHLKGTLSPGKLADFVVLPADPAALDPWELLDLKVSAAYVGGLQMSP
ncbi:MAG: amidohydrolase [Firmicutes bacterium]|nr:amidohydrolase [Bacillota bacterium]